MNRIEEAYKRIGNIKGLEDASPQDVALLAIVLYKAMDTDDVEIQVEKEKIETIFTILDNANIRWHA